MYIQTGLSWNIYGKKVCYMKNSSLVIRIDENVKLRLNEKAKSQNLNVSKVLTDFINYYISDNHTDYVIDNDRSIVMGFVELNDICSGIEDLERRNRALYLLNDLQCRY